MEKMRRQLNQSGFSLIELMIALSLLTIGLLAAVSMQGIAINGNAIANTNTAATAIGQQVMDNLLSVPITLSPKNGWYTRFTTAGTDIPYDWFPPRDGETNTTPTTSYFVPGIGNFSATYDVYIFPDTPSENVARIDVFVWLAGTKLPLKFTNYRKIPA